MKKIQKFIISGAGIFITLSMLVFCMAETESVGSAISEAVMRCLNVIIPSLYAMMIVSSFIVKLGAAEIIPDFITAPAKLIFGMNGNVFVIFLISMFAGYPVGISMLCNEVENGNIEKKEAELLSGVCFGAGPAFIFGCISSQLYGNADAGRTILFSSIAANCITAVIISFKIRSSPKNKTRKKIRKFNPTLLTDCILGSGRSIGNICAMITAFTVISAFLRSTGILETAAGFLSEISILSYRDSEAVLRAVLDVTAVSGFSQNNYTLLPIISGLTSFGGICVIMQIASVAAGKISLKPFIIIRIAAAILSGFICRIIMTFAIDSTAVSAGNINYSAYKAASPIPSFLLLIMTLMLFSEAGKSKNNYPASF